MPRSEPTLGLEVLTRAFETMGRYLADRDVLGEIAVYGGTAILLQFDWRRTTEDVDAVVLDGTREGAIKDAAAYTALKLGLADDWLNNAVGAYTPENEPEAFFALFRSYPEGASTGLRIFHARPEYLCAMKLKALRRADVGDRDFDDVVRLASATDCGTVRELEGLFEAFFPDEQLHPSVIRRLPRIVDAIRRGRPP